MINAKFAGDLLDFSNLQKGEGQPSIGTDEQWVQPQKSGKFRIFYPGGSNMKGGHPIEHKKGRAAFPNIGNG